MSQVETIEQTIRTLPKEQVLELQEWLQDYLEDLEEMRRTLSPASITPSTNSTRAKAAWSFPDRT